MLFNHEPAIEIKDVGKLFFKQEQKTFKEFLPAFFTGKRTAEWFWALKDISIVIQKGESIGIIGSNGSGKSTLLKLIAGVSSPTQGKVITHGKIAPLIELGAGFHPELTGRENTILNGVILGMKRKEVQEKLQNIINFSELSDFIDQPIKHYSSGMYLRLAFSVAIHVHPEIILLDEILAVGDEAFQKKCLEKLQEFKNEGKTIILVSHNMAAVRSFCTRCIFLKHGNIQFDGDTAQAIIKYQKD